MFNKNGHQDPARKSNNFTAPESQASVWHERDTLVSGKEIKQYHRASFAGQCFDSSEKSNCTRETIDIWQKGTDTSRREKEMSRSL